jgi:5-methylcytosine-specific restriction endonuclease McrA
MISKGIDIIELMKLPRTRDEAKAAKSSKYFTNQVCRNGHLSWRWTSRGVCAVCLATHKANPENRAKQNEKDKQLYPKNRERILNRRRKRYSEKREYILTKARAWVATHLDSYKKIKRLWNIKNPDKGVQYMHTRRAKVLANGGNYTVEDIHKIHQLQKKRCYWCTKRYNPEIRNTWQIDHIWPLDLGGTNDSQNLCISCPKCNRAKHAMTPMEFIGRLF